MPQRMGTPVHPTHVELSIEESKEGLLLKSNKSADNSKLNPHQTLVLDLNCETQGIFTKVTSFDVNAIVSLDLSHCKLNYIPDALGDLKLKQLNLSHNTFGTVPNCLKNGLRSLENLDLSYNQLKLFEIQPKCVIKLRILRINHNKLINIPPWILQVNCFNLEELYYSHNETNSWKKSRYDRENSYRLKKLELKNCLLRSEDLKFLKSIRTLTFLDLSNENDRQKNCFISDDSFSQLFENPQWDNRLTVLSLNGLRLSFLSEGIAKLIVLEELYLSRNDLMWLPDALTSMESLRILDISHNQVVSLPTTVIKLKKLEKLLASYNSISSTPDFSSSNIKVLDLYYNYLDTDCNITLNNINEIDLEQNYFSTCDLIDYEEKKNALRIGLVDARVDGPKDIPYDEENGSDGGRSTDSEWDYSNEGAAEINCKDTFDEEESWGTRNEICDNGCTPSDNEWTGKEMVYVSKKIKRRHRLVIPDWMFEDD